MTVAASAPIEALFDVPAPAKLNLFLHITGRRPDGYHLMQSIFMLIDWCDTLHFERRADGHISRSDLPVGEVAPGLTAEALPEDDLCVRAAKALQAACGTRYGVHIRLQKRVPSQAGMGGGSSDAASCLLALQRLWGVALPRTQLLAIALKLGADVPFFLCGSHAWVEGVGEKITPIQLPDARFLVVKPPAGLSTQAIFSSRLLKRDSETATMLGFAVNAEDQSRSAPWDWNFGRNDLQPVALNLCPPVAQSLEWLAAQHLQGRMTGSGSAVFAHLPPGCRTEAVPPLKGEWQVRICGNLKVHPLAGW